MPPRITRKSYRPRASDRTMVDNVQPRSLSCFRIRKRRHENRMDLRRANTPEPLNMTWAGERSEHFCSFQSPEMFFLLTLPFIERAYRTSEIAQNHLSGFPTNQELGRRCQRRLLAVSGFINIHDEREFISARWPRWRQSSGLRAVLNAEHLKGAHNASRQRHHM
jgi:hypothetical protein